MKKISPLKIGPKHFSAFYLIELFYINGPMRRQDLLSYGFSLSYVELLMKTLTELRIFDCKRGPKGGCQLTEEAFGIPLVDIINSLNDAMKDPPEILKPLDEHLAKYIEGKTLGFLLYKLNKGAI